MAERVVPLDLGVVWDPNAPEAVLVSDDLGRTVLALQPHPEDPDRRHVVLVWTGTVSASMAPPNDEAITSHRLYDSGLCEVLWIGVVENSELVDSLESLIAVEAGRGGHAHHVLPLKECVVEVVATAVAVERSSEETTLASASRFAGR